MVRAIRELLQRPPEGDTPCRILNVGRGEPVSLLRMIELLEDNLGQQAVKELLPMQPGDVEATHANIDALRELIAFEPQVSLEEGIARFVSWYRIYRG